MPVLPIGIGAYKRLYDASPEVKLINRFVEAKPVTNPVEKTALLGRPGTSLLGYFAADTAEGTIRGTFSRNGIFNSDLFVVSGKNLWRYDGTTQTHITGEVFVAGNPRMDFVRGADYERLFITDGSLLQYYDGGSAATGLLTYTGDGSNFADYVLIIGGIYYGWTDGSVDANSPAGTSGHPFLCAIGSDGLEAMSNMLNFIGTRGVDFSTALTTASLAVSAAFDDDLKTITLTSRDHTTEANAITLAVTPTGMDMSWGTMTMTGGGVQALHGISLPNGEAAIAVMTLDSFGFVACANSQRFYYIRPGAVVIDGLDFATKESSPDNIVDMVRVGDVGVIMGSSSIEFWSGTGDSDNPFAPVKGRTMSRGILDGTAVMVDEATIILVGNDHRVYAVTSSPLPVSDNGIEERIRRQVRREAGLAP
jgi:hypothetical protein